MARGGISWLGDGLVTAQVTCCCLLIWLGWRGVLGTVWLWPGVIAGIGVSVAGVRAMRLSRLKITPEPGEQAALVDSGIYSHIRHPMYAGLLLAFGMFAIGGGIPGGVTWLGLFLVLWAKLSIEERLWRRRDPAYAGYCSRTRRLIPGLW